MKDVLLPVSIAGKRRVEIKKPDSESMLQVYDYAVEKKSYWRALIALFNDCIIKIEDQDPEPSDITAMPVVSAEYLAVEIFRMFDVPTLVEGLFNCPRPGCGNVIVLEEDEVGYDTRIDITTLPVKYAESKDYTEDWFILDLHGRPKKIMAKDMTVAEVTSITFKDPTVGLMVQVENDHTIKDPSSRLKKVYHECAVSCEAISHDGEPLPIEKVKNRYPYELVKFDDYRTFNEITMGLRRFGIDPFINLVCPACGKKWRNAIEFSSFFGSVLRSNFGSQA